MLGPNLKIKNSGHNLLISNSPLKVEWTDIVCDPTPFTNGDVTDQGLVRCHSCHPRVPYLSPGTKDLRCRPSEHSCDSNEAPCSLRGKGDGDLSFVLRTLDKGGRGGRFCFRPKSPLPSSDVRLEGTGKTERSSV